MKHGVKFFTLSDCKIYYRKWSKPVPHVMKQKSSTNIKFSKVIWKMSKSELYHNAFATENSQNHLHATEMRKKKFESTKFNHVCSASQGLWHILAF